MKKTLIGLLGSVSRKKKNPNLAKIKCLQSVTNSLPF